MEQESTAQTNEEALTYQEILNEFNEYQPQNSQISTRGIPDEGCSNCRRDHTKCKKLHRFRCTEEGCIYVSNAKKDYNQHIKSKHEKIRDLPCPKCDHMDSDATNLKRHVKKHGTDHQYKCAVCRYSTFIKQSWERHELTKKHKVNLKAAQMQMMQNMHLNNVQTTMQSGQNIQSQYAPLQEVQEAQMQMMQFNNVQTTIQNGQSQYAHLQVFDENKDNMAQNVSYQNADTHNVATHQNGDIHHMSNHIRTTDVLAFAIQETIQTEIENEQNALESSATLVTPPSSPSNLEFVFQPSDETYPEQQSNITPTSLITPPTPPPELPKVTVDFINQRGLDHFMDMEL